jgi:hypothetical protein
VSTPPDDDQPRRSHRVGPLGSDVAPGDDPESGGAEPGPASGIAGPSYPPAETEPDAHRRD